MLNPRPAAVDSDYVLSYRRAPDFRRARPRRARSPHALRAVTTFVCAVALVQSAVATPGAAGARPLPTAARTAAAPEDSGNAAYRLLRLFDFDERPLGNYESVPMYWNRLSGEGLPRYSAGRFDEETGHDGAPSFRFDLLGGSICYEYRRDDLRIVPAADYLVVAYIRTADMIDAAAFVETHFVDGDGAVIAESTRVSDVVRSAEPAGAAAGEPAADDWRRVEITLTGDYPLAAALRLRLWVLQDHVWRPRDSTAIDPIIRQDVRATAWFDDIAVYRLPRLRLRLDSPGGIVSAGQPAALVVDANNGLDTPLAAELLILRGREQVHTRQFTVPPAAEAPLRTEIADLPPGYYEAQVRLTGGSRSPNQRSVRFAVLPELPARGPPDARWATGLGVWRNGDSGGADALLAELGVGTVRFDVAMTGLPKTSAEAASQQGLRELVRLLSVRTVRTVGNILPPEAMLDSEHGPTTFEHIRYGSAWHDGFDPIIAQMGSAVGAWQLGHESRESRRPKTWDAASVGRLRRYLQRFVTLPQLVVPRSILDGQAAALATERAGRAAHTICFWVPANVPDADLAGQLSFLVPATGERGAGSRAQPAPAAPPVWLSLESLAALGLSPERAVASDAQRLAIARAFEPDAVLFAAPLRVATSGGQPLWEPDERYIPLRTLLHGLAGMHAVGTLSLGDDRFGILFRDGERSCLVAWRRAPQEQESWCDLYLGGRARGLRLSGEPFEVRQEARRCLLPLSPAPVLILDVEVELILLQSGVRLEPREFELHTDGEQPALRLRNPFSNVLNGVARISGPPNWRVLPASSPFSLAPGQALEIPLELELPPRQLAAALPIDVRLELRDPVATSLDFRFPVEIGLRDIALAVETRWRGDDLQVDVTLTNRTPQPISFAGFCHPPGRRRSEGEFVGVAPQGGRQQTFLISGAADLVGRQIHIGVRELGGPRALDQLVEVPPR